MTIIETKGLTKRFETALAVEGLDLAMREDEVLGFLGPNGADKTTTDRSKLPLSAIIPAMRYRYLPHSFLAVAYCWHPSLQ